ncbi:MAG: glycosyltransferase family 39 protein [bacterium]|nr:glycosyltransferase family 39 protein [bacterium]
MFIKIKSLLKNKWLVLIFIIAVVLRLVFLYASYAHYGNNLLQNIALDDYYRSAIYFAKGLDLPHYDEDTNIYSDDGFRAPGYSLLMAPFIASNSIGLFLFIQVLASSIIPILSYFLSLKLFPQNKKLAYGVGTVLALEPLSILLSIQLVTETLFTILFLIVFIKLLDYGEQKSTSFWQLALLGLFIGLATLVRPITIYLPYAFCAFALWKKITKNLSLKTFIVQVFIVASIFYITILPWIYRNYKTFGVWGFTSARSGLGVVVWAPSIISLGKNITYAEAQTELFKEITPDGSQPYIDITKEKEYNRILWQTIKEHPKGFLLSVLGGVFQFWTHDNYITVVQFLGYLTDYETLKLPTPPLFTMLTHPKLSYLPHIVSYLASPAIIIVLSRLLWIAAAVLALGGVIKYVVKNKLDAKILLILLVVVYFSIAAATMGIGLTGRVRQPINSLVLIMAGYALLRIKKHVTTV